MASLEAYSNYKDAINAFRLCHRLGRGPGVHVSKLPRELELAIEELVIKEARNAISESWVSEFRCVEARCAPIDHSDLLLKDMTYGELFEEMFHDSAPCCMCKGNDGMYHCELDCPACIKRVESAINEQFVDEDAISLFHSRNLHKWQKLFPAHEPGIQNEAGKLRKVSY